MPDPARQADGILDDGLANRGTAFTDAERAALGLDGRLPPRVESLGEQVARSLDCVRAITSPIGRYTYLRALQDDNETLFYRLLIDHLQELLPLVYTPTVGQACLEWSRRYLRPRGLYLTSGHRGSIAGILRRWPHRDVSIIVVTDGGRILGLGDLGANGMGIPIGKLALYTACAGVPPAGCLPVTLDVGTGNASVRNDPCYLGIRSARLPDAQSDALVDEFIQAARQEFPGVIIQFEDFNNASAFRLLARYRDRICCFNDDMQGTGAMGLAGLYAAARCTGRALRDERLLFVGAGQACLGIGAAVVRALQQDGLTPAQASARCLFVDSAGTVVTSRTDLPPHKRAVAQDLEVCTDLVSTIARWRPTTLIGACGQGGMFTQPVLAELARHHPQVLVFALSNPTSKAECTAEQAYAWTGGRALFASGSPCEPVRLDGRVHAPGQANNSYVFPGVGLGVMLSGATRVSDQMFLAAARALADMPDQADLDAGRLYPQQARMREVAAAVAAAVMRTAAAQGLATRPVPDDPQAVIAAAMYWPAYGPA